MINKRSLRSGSLFSHIGILLILIGVAVSFFFSERGMISISEGEISGVCSSDGDIHELPFEIKLDSFSMATSAMDFKSYITILEDGREVLSGTTSVNHPLKYDGYYLYQSQFDPEDPKWTSIEVVKDPGAPIFFAGVILLNIGVIIFFCRSSLKVTIVIIGVLSALASIVALGHTFLFSTLSHQLMPALKSVWLYIHVTAYFAAYGALALATILAGGSLVLSATLSHKKECSHKLQKISSRLIVFAFPFLTIGLTSGAAWASDAWGRYWGWDPKETWALITWLVYALYLHLLIVRGWRGKRMAALAVVGFIFVIFTFFGVNFLLGGLHSYR